MTSAAIDLEQAKLDPQSVFRTPSDVLAASGLSPEDKKAILIRWEADVEALLRATEEGMPPSDPQPGGVASYRMRRSSRFRAAGRADIAAAVKLLLPRLRDDEVAGTPGPLARLSVIPQEKRVRKDGPMPPKVTTTEARQGTGPKAMFWVLIISLTLAVIAGLLRGSAGSPCPLAPPLDPEASTPNLSGKQLCP
jgi:hypothetical protein